ncbi:MAG: hypothetical protein HQM00_16565 [Magnetococcales bacterium]|nr:hypothetical protein [Magnetococcales bacterium]
MHIKWSKQADGFHQATYPCKKYRLSATLINDQVVDGIPTQQSIILGRVVVEENSDGTLKFLFGSHLYFWPGAREKLKGVEMSPEQSAEIFSSLAAIIPLPE